MPTMGPPPKVRLRSNQKQPEMGGITPPTDLAPAPGSSTKSQKHRRGEREQAPTPAPATDTTATAPKSSKRRRTEAIASTPAAASSPTVPLPTPSPENMNDLPEVSPAPPPPPTNSNTNRNTTNTTADKKARLRLRNREAAQKCRKRKQRGINDLQAQEAAASSLHEALLAEAAQLRGEVLLLKNMVLQHGACGCPYIEDYIRGQASSLATNTEPYPPGAPNFEPADDGSLSYGLSPMDSQMGSHMGSQMGSQMGSPLDSGVQDPEMNYIYGGMLGFDESQQQLQQQQQQQQPRGFMFPDIPNASPVPQDDPNHRLPSLTPFSLDMDRSIDPHV